MNSIGVCFLLCALVSVAKGDDKAELIASVNKLIGKITALDDKLLKFEKQNDLDISKVKSQFTESEKKVDDAAAKVAGAISNDFCNSKTADFKNYDKEVTKKIADGQDSYNTAVKIIKDDDSNTRKVLADLIVTINKCAEGDETCIATQKESFTTINEKEQTQLDKYSATVEKAIGTFKSIVDDAVTDTTNKIPKKTSDATTCFDGLFTAKTALDKFKQDLGDLVKKDTDALNKQVSDFDNTITDAIKTLGDSLLNEEDAAVKTVTDKKEAADKKKADIKTCEIDKVRPTLDAVVKEIVALFTKDAASVKTNVKSVVGAAVSFMNDQNKISDDILKELTDCGDLKCITNTKSECDTKWAAAKKSIPAKSSEANKKITQSKDDMQTTIIDDVHRFVDESAAKAKPCIDCITLQINKADINALVSSVVDLTSEIGVKITKLNLNTEKFRSDWFEKEQDGISDLEKYLLEIITYVNSNETDAASHSVGIEKCLKNKTDLYEHFLPNFTTNVTSKINVHYKEVDDRRQNCIKQMNDFYTDAHALIDSVRKCSEEDAECVSKAQTEFKKSITDIQNKENTIGKDLTDQIKTSDTAMKSDFDTILKDAKESGNATAYEMIQCIRREIGNSAIVFSPSLILLLFGFLTQLYYNVL